MGLALVKKLQETYAALRPKILELHELIIEAEAKNDEAKKEQARKLAAEIEPSLQELVDICNDLQLLMNAKSRQR